MLKKYFLLFTVAFACSEASDNTQDKYDLVIAMGSCNDQDLPQPMWEFILDDQPDAWVWLGDNIYGDEIEKELLLEAYDKQLSNAQYQKLISTTEVTGTWDDHDYGVNNGGKNHPGREGSKEAFMDFMNISEDHPMRSREGIYYSKYFRQKEVVVKLILLDSRYFRDDPTYDSTGYLPNTSGTVLGEIQWEWLEGELNESKADINLIGNGIQVLPTQHPFEKWENFPVERQRLLNMIKNAGTSGVILLSGDRHIAEISEISVPGMSYPIREITTSGLTHSYEEVGEEPNALRVSSLIGQKNYALLKFRKAEGKIEADVTLKGINDTIFYNKKWEY